MNQISELIRRLTLDLNSEYPALVADTEATGLEIPEVRGNRPRNDAAFFASGAPSMGGAGQGPQGRRRVPGISTCSVAAHPFEIGEAVNQNRSGVRTMTNNLSAVFSFNSTAVRTLAADNGEPLFSASDVCAILGYRNPWDATAKHCKEHGLAKREVIDELGRTQEMTFINEGNLYRLIIKSRKPEAEAFEQWVMEEVLPAIRKTGSYRVAAAQPVPEAHETLNHKDMGNLTRLVWLICNSMWGEKAWTQAVWYRLRQVTGTPSPSRFQVRHLPIIASEIRRIFAMTQTLKESQREADRLLIKRVLRGGEAEGPILEQARQLAAAAVAADEAEMTKLMSSWHDHEIAAITERREGYHGKFLAAYSEQSQERKAA